jgi:hypothetical protein
MSTALYPTQLALHPQPGALMAYRDGVFGQRPQAPNGQLQSAFDNGVLGPALGTLPPMLDGGPLRSFRDGIFNFPRGDAPTPHPVTAYEDGIFGGASLGLGAETAEPVTNGPSADPNTPVPVTNGNGNGVVTNGAAAPSNGAVVNGPLPPVAPLDMTKPSTVAEVVSFVRLLAGAYGIPAGTAPKTEWDKDCSDTLNKVLDAMLAAAPPAETARYTAVLDRARAKVGDLYYPTGVFFVVAGASAPPIDLAPASHPALAAYYAGCFSRLFDHFDLSTTAPTASDMEAFANQACPVILPAAGMSRAVMVGGAVVGVALLWLLLRR